MIVKFYWSVLILFIAAYFTSATIFDDINWEYEKTHRSVKLYVQKNQANNLNYYKAETIIDGIKFDDLINDLMSFDAYDKIFPRTNFFKIIKKVDENNCIVNADLNFFPYKNRNYYIECISEKMKTGENKNKFIVEWHPADNIKYASLIEPCENAKRITYTYGRWSVVELDNGRLYISVEYHNDWETNLPMVFVYGAEKSTIFTNIFSILKYSRKN